MIAASTSANPVKRANAVRAFVEQRDARLVDPLLKLLKDETPLVRLLAVSSRLDTVMVAMRLVEGNGLIQRPLSEAETVARQEALRARRLTSTEATVLATNRLSQVRLTSLKILERNGDAKAVELVLPLLRDPNSVVRSRAFATLQAISGTSVSENDPAKWEKWWADNKATLKPRD